MIRPPNEGIEVWLCVEPVDFRKQIPGLAALVQDTLAMDPFSTHLFVFTNRRRTQCRILYWERCGFVLWQKRLERGCENRALATTKILPPSGVWFRLYQVGVLRLFSRRPVHDLPDP